MNRSYIYLSRYDHQRLCSLLANAADGGHWSELRAELQRAIVLPVHARVPHYVVTVGTHVQIQDVDTGETTDMILTLPGETAFGTATAVSVIEPLGTALLGCMQGDVVEVRAGGSRRRLKIIRVVQSSVAEAAATLTEV